MKKNNNIVDLINNFIGKYYHSVNGVLFFGSASFNANKFQDIDLLIIDDKFSYTSKSNVYYLGNHFSIIKLSNYDIFNILADDYEKGIYKNIFETGFIIKDDIKLLTFIKQYIEANYPDDYKAIGYNLNKCVFKINESINSLNRKLPLTESFLIFSNLISFLIEFIILQDGKINFSSPKHKSRYLHQYHLNESIILNDIINTYKKNSEEAFSKITNFIRQIDLPHLNDYHNDYIVEYLDSMYSLTLYVPKTLNRDFYNNLTKYLDDENIQFYSYWIDKNNIEESGLYFIIKNIGKTFFEKIKTHIKVLLGDEIFFFPYNMSFNQEIKFGGIQNYNVIEKLFYKIQSDIHLFLNDEIKYLTLILFVINYMQFSIIDIDTYYFYKTINNNHNLSIEDIINKEKTNKMNSDNKNGKKIIDSNQIEFDWESEFSGFENIEKYFQIQVFDRILSMLLLSDTEKRKVVGLLKNQALANV